MLILLLFTIVFGQAPAQEVDPGAWGLPDPLTFQSGSPVRGAADWPARKAEMIQRLLTHQYGSAPPAPKSVHAEPIASEVLFDGAARLDRFALSWTEAPGFRIECGLIRPTAPGSHPVIVAVEPVWQEHLRPTAQQVIARGYALAGLPYHDVDSDKNDRSVGIYPHYPDYRWGSIAAWAWATSSLIDHLVTRDEIDEARIAITGHSRCGKAAILAGALDDRIALVAPHCSGTGGAALYRVRNAGSETLAMITHPGRFHYWFVSTLRTYAGHEQTLPFDQHFLHALIAPRAFLSLEGRDDRWANPRGAWAACVAALPVYRMLGSEDHLAYHIRPGGHDTIPEDWKTLLDFADSVFEDKPLAAPTILRGAGLCQEPALLPSKPQP